MELFDISSTAQSFKTCSVLSIMTPSLAITSTHDKYIMYLGLIGASLSLTTSLILLCHVSYHYYNHIWKQKQDSSKYGYILLFTFFIASTITSLCNLLIRTNFITHINPSQFTQLQCKIGYLLFYFAGSITTASLYLMLLYRIKVIFKGSIFEYEPYIFKIYYFIIFMDIFIFIADRIFRTLYLSKFELHVLSESALWGTTTLKWTSCSSNTNGHIINLRYTLIFTSIMHVFLAMSFLYMFVKRLRGLNRGMIKRFLAEHCVQHSDSKTNQAQKDNEDVKRISNTLTVSSASRTTTKSYTVDTVIGEFRSSMKSKIKKKQMSDSVYRIIELNDLMKKQTILVIIAIMSTLIFWLAIGINTRYTGLFGYDFAINAIAVWLMSGVAKKYWKCCTRYGIFRCCYYKEMSLDNEIDTKAKGVTRLIRANTTNMVDDAIEMVITHKKHVIDKLEEQASNDKDQSQYLSVSNIRSHATLNSHKQTVHSDNDDVISPKSSDIIHGNNNEENEITDICINIGSVMDIRNEQKEEQHQIMDILHTHSQQQHHQVDNDKHHEENIQKDHDQSQEVPSLDILQPTSSDFILPFATSDNDDNHKDGRITQFEPYGIDGLGLDILPVPTHSAETLTTPPFAARHNQYVITPLAIDSPRSVEMALHQMSFGNDIGEEENKHTAELEDMWLESGVEDNDEEDKVDTDNDNHQIRIGVNVGALQFDDEDEDLSGSNHLNFDNDEILMLDDSDNDQDTVRDKEKEHENGSDDGEVP